MDQINKLFIVLPNFCANPTKNQFNIQIENGKIYYRRIWIKMKRLKDLNYKLKDK